MKQTKVCSNLSLLLTVKKYEKNLMIYGNWNKWYYDV